MTINENEEGLNLPYAMEVHQMPSRIGDKMYVIGWCEEKQGIYLSKMSFETLKWSKVANLVKHLV